MKIWNERWKTEAMEGKVSLNKVICHHVDYIDRDLLKEYH